MKRMSSVLGVVTAAGLTGALPAQVRSGPAAPAPARAGFFANSAPRVSGVAAAPRPAMAMAPSHPIAPPGVVSPPGMSGPPRVVIPSLNPKAVPQTILVSNPAGAKLPVKTDLMPGRVNPMPNLPGSTPPTSTTHIVQQPFGPATPDNLRSPFPMRSGVFNNSSGFSGSVVAPTSSSSNFSFAATLNTGIDGFHTFHSPASWCHSGWNTWGWNCGWNSWGWNSCGLNNCWNGWCGDGFHHGLFGSCFFPLYPYYYPVYYPPYYSTVSYGAYDQTLSPYYDPAAAQAAKDAAAASANTPPMTDFERAGAFMRYGDYAESTRAFRAAVKADPGDMPARRWLGVSLLLLGRTQDGCAEVYRAYASEPDLAESSPDLESMGLSERQMSDLCAPVITYAKRMGSAQGFVTAAMLMQVRSRPDLAVKMIDSAREAGLDNAIAVRLNAAMTK